ncbi:phage portal protein [Larkinella soli]|uniref:phage portal protein n=1 Tax=Larkinella soli TaxID=1770527 RepID=UPI000FFBD685|nr:phage portal protein [Larkinella soli]
MNALQRTAAKVFGLTPHLKAEVFQPGPGPRARFSYVVANGRLQLYDWKVGTLIDEGYLKNSDLYSVVTFIIRKAMRAPFYLYQVRDEKSLRSYKTLTGEDATSESLKAAKLMRTKALEEVDGDHPIKNLLERPNPYQTGLSFREAAIGYELLSGKRFIRVNSGALEPQELYIYPSPLMEIKAGDNYGQIKGFRFTPWQEDFTPEQMIYSHNFRPSIEGYGAELEGLSPLEVLAFSLQEGNDAKKQSITQYQNGGPKGILTLDDKLMESLTEDQAAQIEYNIGSKVGGIHVSSVGLKWMNLGLSPKDLALQEARSFALRDFCNVYGLDHRLFGADATFNNRNEAKKAAIVDAVIPRLMSLRDDLNRAFEPFNRGGKRYFVDCDVTDFPEMQEDMDKMVDRLTKAWWLTPNQRLAAMQYEEDASNPLMNERWVPSGFTPMSEYGMQPGQNEVPENDGSY